MIEITSQTQLDLVIATGGPVLVDFYANWCSPCQAMNSVLEHIEMAYGERLRVVAVNIDTHPELASKYEIRALPSILLIVKGEVFGQLSGRVTLDRLTAWLTRNCPELGPESRLAPRA